MTPASLAIHAPSGRPRLALGAVGAAAILTGAHVANDALTSMLSGLLPLLQARHGLTDTTLALLVAALALSASATQPLLGAVSDRFGARRVAAIGTTFGISMLSLLAIAPNAGVLFLLLLLGGLGSAAFHPAAASLLAGSPLRRRELGVGLFSAGGTVGLALGPLLVLAAAATLGLGRVPLLIPAAVVLGGVIYLLVPSGAPRPRPERAPILDRALFRGRVGALAAAATFASVAFVAFTAAYPLFLVRERGLDPSDPLIGLTLAAFNVGAAGGAVLAGLVANRLDERVLVGGTLAGSLLPLFMLLLIPPAGLPYIVAAAAAGALLNGNLPILLVAAQRMAPGSAAAASGMLMGLPVGVAGVAYVLVGRLQEAAGIGPATAVAFLAVLPAALVAVAALEGRAGRRAEEAHPPRARPTPRCCGPAQPVR